MKKIRSYQMQLEEELMHGMMRRMRIRWLEVLLQNLKKNSFQKRQRRKEERMVLSMGKDETVTRRKHRYIYQKISEDDAKCRKGYYRGRKSNKISGRIITNVLC